MEDETRLVRVHSGAIHIENKTKLVQRKVWFELVYKALPLMNSTNEFSITIRELKESLGWDKSKNDDEIKELLHQLTSTSVQWNILEKDKSEVWESSSLLAGCRIVKGSGICNYAFSPFLQKKLLNPEMYAKIDLIVSHKFKSKYSLAIYCLALDYLNINLNYGEKNLTVVELRKYLGLLDNEYKLVGDLNRRVIKPSEEEINEISDMIISITPIINKKKIVGFKFVMKLHEKRVFIYKSKKYLDTVNVHQTSLFEDIEKGDIKKLKLLITIKDEKLKKFFAKYNISTITDTFQEKLKEVKEMFGEEKSEKYITFLSNYAESEYKKGTIKNFSGFFVSLLKDNTQIENYLYEAEKEDKILETKRIKIESLVESKIKENYESSMSNDFNEYLINNIDKLEPKFIELVTKNVIKGFAYDYLIMKQNKGVIDKTLISNYPNHIRAVLINELRAYQDELNYKKPTFEQWKKKTVNEKYLVEIKKEIEKSI